MSTIKLKGKFVVKNITGNSKLAKICSIGDIISLEIPIKSTSGGNSIYASYILLKNETQKTATRNSMTVMCRMLESLELEEVS